MQKKVYILFGGLFLIIFLLGIISANSCNIVERSSCDGTILMGLSDSTNAHGELWDEGYYEYVLCCDFVRSKTCSGTNKIVGLSDITNAHAEIPSLDNYENDVCYENLECINTDICNEDYSIEMISLSDETNAHIGGFDAYDTKICCNDLTDIEVYDYTIDLKEGWNLISIPVEPMHTDIAIVFDGIKENLDIIWSYQYDDYSGENKWSFYTPTIGDLNEIVPGYGYFVIMKEADILQGMKKEVTIPALPVPSVKLASNSWNLIGRFGTNPISLIPETAFESLTGRWYKESLLEWDGINDWNPADSVNVNGGYWLRTKYVEDDYITYEPITYYFY